MGLDNLTGRKRATKLESSTVTLPWNLHPLLKTKALLHLLIASYFVIEVASVSTWKAPGKGTDK